jgi:bifunctional DNA-binding transcriptional regulator/antitoxin component of YhaV-PrlF toxin-antitoxin module
VVGVTAVIPTPTLVPSLYLPPRMAEAPERIDTGLPLRLPELIGTRQRATVYGFTAVDVRGRLADGRVMAALGWQPGPTLSIGLADQLVMVASAADGRHAVGGQGRVHLPAAVRFAAGIGAGDRVLLAAEPDECTLTVYSLSRLDAMITTLHASKGDGG